MIVVNKKLRLSISWTQDLIFGKFDRSNNYKLYKILYLKILNVRVNIKYILPTFLSFGILEYQINEERETN